MIEVSAKQLVDMIAGLTLEQLEALQQAVKTRGYTTIEEYILFLIELKTEQWICEQATH